MGRPLKTAGVRTERLQAGVCEVLLSLLEAGEDPWPAGRLWDALPQYAKDANRQNADVARITAFRRDKLGLGTGTGWPSKIQEFRRLLGDYVRRGAPLTPDLPADPEELEALAEAPTPEPSPAPEPEPREDFGDPLPLGSLAGLKSDKEREERQATPRKRDRRGSANPFERPEGVQEALRGLDPSKLDELSDLEQLKRVRKAIFAQLVISPGSSFRGLMFSLDQINKQIQQLEQEGGDNVDLERNPVACAVAILEELEAALVLLGVPAYRAKDLASECREAARVAERPPLPPAPAPSGDPSAPPYAPPGYGEELPEEDSGEGW